MPNKLEKNASKTPRNPGSSPSNIDIERLLEITKQAAILEGEVDILKKEIESSQNEINSNKEALDKIGDKRKSDYKALDNRIGLGIRLVTEKREELAEKNKELRKAKEMLRNVANISASKNVPPRATQEDTEKKESNNLQAKAKKLAEDFDNEEKRNDFTDEDRKIINTETFKSELKKVRIKNQAVENIRRKIAGSELGEVDLSGEEQIERDILLFNTGEREKINAIKDDLTKKKKEKADSQRITEEIEADKKAKEEKTKKDIDTIAEKLNSGTALSAAEQMQLKKHEKDIIELAKNKTDQNKIDSAIRESIIAAENDGKDLTIEQKAFVNRPGERSGIDAEKIKRQTETAAAKAKADADAAIAKSKAEREAFGKLDRAGKRAKALERYQKMAEKVFEKKTLESGVEETDAEQQARISNFQRQSQEKRDRANVRREGDYAKAAKEYQDIIGNAEYIKLKKEAAHLGTNQKAILAQYEERLNNAKKKAEQTGPLGSTYIDLESARRELAKSSQEYKHSFKRKFIGSRVLAGISNMFGFKYSGIKEGDHTKEAHHHLEEAQAKYDNLRQKIMQGTLAEDYDVNKIVKFNDASLAQRMQTMVEVADKRLIVSEHEKLEDLKHVLEDTVKKPAFLQFAKWYKNNYYGFIKNEHARRVAQRVTNALVLSGAVWATGGLAGVAVGVAGGRALISGAVGEGAAIAVNAIGGKKNERGEYSKFAAKRDNERLEAATLMSRAIYEQVSAGNKPDVSRPIFRDRVVRDEKANINMQMREMRLRKGEMWARLVAGGSAGYLSSYFINDAIPIPGHGTDITPTPKTDHITLEGVSVDATPKGAINDFMALKEKMINHYINDPRFSGLSKDQIAEKMINNGNLDSFSEDIMGARSLQEFMNVAEKHGFWKPEGWGNSAIDSASVPKGSIIGFAEGADKDLHFFIKLPDGKEIPINDNFQEALNQHLKGVSMIDSNHIGSHSGHTGIGGGHNIDNTPVPAPTNAGDGLGGGDNVPGDDFVPGPSVGSNIDGATNLNTLDQLIAKYKGVGNPGSEHEYLTSHGYGWSGKQGYGPVKSSQDMATEYYDAQRVNKYLTPNDSRYNEIPPGGTLPGYPNIHRIDDLALHKQWQMEHKSYEDAQTEIIKLENVKRQYETDALNAKMYPNRPAGTTSTIDQAAIDRANAIDAARADYNTNFVNKHFTEGNKAGTNTDEWHDFSKEKMSDHIRGKVNDDAYGPDDKIRFSGSRDERKFLDDVYKTGQKYEIEPRGDETVEQYMNRVSTAEAKAKAAIKE